MAGTPGDRPDRGTGSDSTGPTVDRRRLDEIFGVVLPDITDDERDPEQAADAESERWYRENRPPHHGD